jgi:hypothetical protein
MHRDISKFVQTETWQNGRTVAGTYLTKFVQTETWQNGRTVAGTYLTKFVQTETWQNRRTVAGTYLTKFGFFKAHLKFFDGSVNTSVVL